MGNCSVVFVTYPNGKAANRVSDYLLKNRLAACANHVAGVRSAYWWKGKLETAREVLVIYKTRTSLVRKFTATVKKLHPYEVPEIIALPISKGNPDYLKWIEQSTNGRR